MSRGGSDDPAEERRVGSDESVGESPVDPPTAVEYGETWVYESIIGAVPGVDLSQRAAFAVQFGLFEAALLVLLVWLYLDGR